MESHPHKFINKDMQEKAGNILVAPPISNPTHYQTPPICEAAYLVCV